MDDRTYDKDTVIADNERKWRDHTMSEEVNGIIIGGEYKTYKFFKTVTIAGQSWQEEFAYGWHAFDDDAQAEAWLKEHYPAEYAQGVEMRCYE